MSNSAKSKTCVFTVIYPSAEPYLDDFVKSVTEQDDLDFELLVINDGVDQPQRYFKSLPIKVHIKDFTSHKPAIRSYGIRQIKQMAFEYVVFADADDMMSKNRVRCLRELLAENQIAFNELDIIDEEGKIIDRHYLSNRIETGKHVSLDDIKKKNVLGLGNSGIRGHLLRNIEFPSDMIAVDWYLFTTILVQGESAIFTNETTCSYRQHQLNSAGFRRITSDRIEKSFQVQIFHCKALASTDEYYNIRAEKLSNTFDLYTRDKSFRETYQNKIVDFLPYPLWWEEAMTLDEIYEN